VIVLDTDHTSVLKYRDTDRYSRLVARLATVQDDVVGTTIITVEEHMRGWLSSIVKERQVRRQVRPYSELKGLFEFYGEFEILPFDEKAVEVFEQLLSIRIGAHDRKIAAITLANDGLLLTANRSDFEQVPGLRFENWMD
jgi:tRNA(fMet)-specific endonuclease VapC